MVEFRLSGPLVAGLALLACAGCTTDSNISLRSIATRSEYAVAVFPFGINPEKIRFSPVAENAPRSHHATVYLDMIDSEALRRELPRVKKAVESVSITVDQRDTTSRDCAVSTFEQRPACLTLEMARAGYIVFLSPPSTLPAVSIDEEFGTNAIYADSQPVSKIWVISKGLVVAEADVFDWGDGRAINFEPYVSGRGPAELAALFCGLDAVLKAPSTQGQYLRPSDPDHPCREFDAARIFIHE